MFLFFFFKQKTAYEMRISDWSSDVCSSDLASATGRSRIPADGSEALFFGSSPNSGEGFLLLVRSRASSRPDGPGATCRPSGQMSPGIRLRRLPPPFFCPEGLQPTPAGRLAGLQDHTTRKSSVEGRRW